MYQICSVDGCGSPASIRGWCNAHYNRWKRHGDVQADKPIRGGGGAVKFCSTGCGRLVLARGWCATHYQRWHTTGDPGGLDLLRTPGDPDTLEKKCTACGIVLPKSSFYEDTRNRDGRMSHCKTCTKRRQKPARMARKYGLSIERYRQMMSDQSGECAICKLTTRLVVDHDHRTGKVRALLCDRCNRMLGIADDDIGLMLRAIEFLKQHAAA